MNPRKALASLFIIGLCAVSMPLLAMEMGSMAGTSKPAGGAAKTYLGKGVVNSIDRAGRRINLSHDAIPALGWPAMTMSFPVADEKLVDEVRPGVAVAFELAKTPTGSFQITTIAPAK